jgi:16S rRNA (guanine527-N7)-methyltransferase
VSTIALERAASVVRAGLVRGPKKCFYRPASDLERTTQMAELSNAEIQRLLKPYGVDASDHLCAQARKYISLLVEWNRRISLTTVTDPAQIVRFHFGESMFAASAVPIRNGRLADVGAGPGFPSIPLSMVIKDLLVVPIESNSKKCTFMSEAARALELPLVRPYRGRMEDFPASDTSFDWITARALGMHRGLLDWAASALNPTGSVVLWLGESDASELSKHEAWSWREPIKIPASDRRFILVGRPAVRQDLHCFTWNSL